MSRQSDLTQLLQHLEPEGSRLAHVNHRDIPACETLRKMRTELGLTLAGVCTLYSLVQALAVLGELNVGEDGNALVSIGESDKPVQLKALKKLHVQDFLGKIDSLDITHLSKFERGGQLPWTRARARLTLLFSLIYGRRLEVSDVFPELEAVPGLKSSIKSDNLLEI